MYGMHRQVGQIPSLIHTSCSRQRKKQQAASMLIVEETRE